MGFLLELVDRHDYQRIGVIGHKSHIDLLEKQLPNKFKQRLLSEMALLPVWKRPRKPTTGWTMDCCTGAGRHTASE